MSKLIACVLPFAISLLAIVFVGCDDYNIVEPRFYMEDDLVEIRDCGGDPFVEPEEGIDDDGNRIFVVQPKLIPTMFSVDACWHKRDEGIMAVFFALPIASSVTMSILNSGGGVEEVLFDGSEQAGYYVVPWVVEKDGVYALSLQTERWIMAVWFEVK